MEKLNRLLRKQHRDTSAFTVQRTVKSEKQKRYPVSFCGRISFCVERGRFSVILRDNSEPIGEKEK